MKIAVIAAEAVKAPSGQRRLAQYAWFTLFYNIFVILWGSLVRATGSGAGCGEHWPLCNGQVVPVLPRMHTVIEFTHRATSGLALLAVIALYIWVRRGMAQRTAGRRAASFSLLFMVNETLIGALLVLLGLVAGSHSPWRALVLGIHLINTILLLGALTLTAWFATHGEGNRWERGRVRNLFYYAAGVVIVLSAAGGIAALGDTLFPSTSVAAGMREEFSRDAHLFVRLRVVHPILAVLGGGYLLWLVSFLQGRVSPVAERWGYLMGACVLIQFGLGAMNILMLTPVWTQLTHLLVTDILWVSLVIFGAHALSEEVR